VVQSPGEPEPDQSGRILKVGQDPAGHWLVQENNGKLEGRFVSFAEPPGAVPVPWRVAGARACEMHPFRLRLFPGAR